jgi:hypothetical protein
MALIWKAKEITAKTKEAMDLFVKQKFNDWDDLVNLDQDELDGYKKLNELFTVYTDYAEEHAKSVDAISTKLDEIQKQLLELKEKEA